MGYKGEMVEKHIYMAYNFVTGGVRCGKWCCLVYILNISL